MRVMNHDRVFKELFSTFFVEGFSLGELSADLPPTEREATMEITTSWYREGRMKAKRRWY